MKITIARECGCYGDEVGQVLADRLNVPLYNKKTLTELAKKREFWSIIRIILVRIRRERFWQSLRKTMGKTVLCTGHRGKFWMN